MIIDRVQVSGHGAYFQATDNLGQINLGGDRPASARTAPLTPNQQLEVSGIQLIIQAKDLLPLFNMEKRWGDKPLFSITVMKEMFPGLFADPFQHRVHNIAGFDDFKRGTFENCKVMDIDGIPTLVSLGSGSCKWKSPIYPMPTPYPRATYLDIPTLTPPRRFNAVSWELATSRQTPADSFDYSVTLNYWNADEARENNLDQYPLADDWNPTAPRMVQLGDQEHQVAADNKLRDIKQYQIEFSANVFNDSYVYEKHSPIINESIGRPLLRAVNLLEPVEPMYNFYTLSELLSLSSNYHLFEISSSPLTKMLATIDLSATLVHSDNQDERSNSNDYEFVEIQVFANLFEIFEAKMKMSISVNPQKFKNF